MKKYSDDEMLMLSGIQHYKFCPRQWALIHIEQLWEDNKLTIEGNILHKHVDDPFYRGKQGDKLIWRSVNIVSKKLGLYGLADLIELSPSPLTVNTIQIPEYQNHWTPLVIEYKHGKPKANEIDEIQLGAQIMCLEEMYGIEIHEGEFYYGKIRQRVKVEITNKHRQLVEHCAEEMHMLFKESKIPKGRYGSHCKNCSLFDLCMPEIETDCVKVKTYLINNLL